MFEAVAKRDANKRALKQAKKATDSEPVKGKKLLESDEANIASMQIRLDYIDGEIRKVSNCSGYLQFGRVRFELPCSAWVG